MIATWTVGREANWNDVVDLLTTNTFDVVVILTGTTLCMEIRRMETLSGMVTDGQELLDAAVAERKLALARATHIINWDSRICVSLNRNKTKGMTILDYDMRKTTPHVRLAVFDVMLDTSKQRLPQITICVLKTSFRPAVADDAMDQIADLIGRHNTSILTGYFGVEKDFVEQLAKKTHAVIDRPLAQLFHVRHLQDENGKWFWETNRSGGKEHWTLCFIPTYFILLGEFRQVRLPKQF